MGVCQTAREAAWRETGQLRGPLLLLCPTWAHRWLGCATHLAGLSGGAAGALHDAARLGAVRAGLIKPDESGLALILPRRAD